MDQMHIDTDGMRLALYHQPPSSHRQAGHEAVLYIHGATFPSSLAVFWRFGSTSWADALGNAGLHVFGLDFAGFGASDRYPEMDAAAVGSACRGRAEEAAGQIEAAVRYIRSFLGVCRVSLIAHSWGSMPAALYATQRPDTVGRLVLFAPITLRTSGAGVLPPSAAWHLVSAEDQWNRFTAMCPDQERPVLLRSLFDPWAVAYLRTDPNAHAHEPPAVKVPGGPVADIMRAAGGQLPYDPAAVVADTLIIRGEWDDWPTDADAHWLFGALRRAPAKRDVKISRGTHVMHLEESRFTLYQETAAFLSGLE